MADVTIPYRQQAIVKHMVESMPRTEHTTREIASALSVTTNAVLAALKRLRTKGSVYEYGGKWCLTIAEKERQGLYAT